MEKKILLIHSIQNNPVAQVVTQAAKDVLDENLASFQAYKTSALLEIPSLLSIISEHADYSGVVVTGVATTSRERLVFPNFYQVCVDTASVYSLPLGFGVYVGDGEASEQELAVIGADAACSCVELVNLSTSDPYETLTKHLKYTN